MIRTLLLALAFVAVAFGQLSIRVAGENPSQFILGEKVFISVFIDGVSGNAPVEREQGTSPYVLENVSGNAGWLKPNGRPPYDAGLDNAYDHWQNNQTFWLELSGFAPSVGNYSGQMRVRNTLTGEHAESFYSFQVVEPTSYYYGTVIAMHDSAASYGRQMELYTSIKNTATGPRTLLSPYIDYYGMRQPGRQPVINVWKKPSNGCVQVLDCGQGNFVIRHRFSGDVTIGAGGASGEFQIGYNEVAGPSDPYYYSALQDKDLQAFLREDWGYNPVTQMNAYLDYSAPRWAASYIGRAMQRNLFYNSREALYDHSGNRLWGSAPSWYSEQGCSIVRVTDNTTYNWQRFRTNSVSSGFCTDGLVNTAPEIQFPTAGPDTIYEGEDYFMRPVVTDADGDGFTMELVGAHPSWIEVGTPADYWDDYENVVNNNVNTEANRKVFYIRSRHDDVRRTTAKAPGVYTYTVKVNDSYGASSTATRTIVILDGVSHPQHTASGLAVLVGDETWFKRYQLDVASGIVNYSGASVALSAGWHYDYYGAHAERPFSSLPTAHYWYTDPNVDVTYKACGSGRFRLRYTGKTAQNFLANRSYQDSKVGFVYGISMNKVDDWSIEDFYAGGDTLRRRQYAPKAPLYDGDGTLLWGEAPSWAADCGDNSSSSSSSLWSSSSTTGQSSSSVYPPNSSSNPISSSSVQPVSSSSIPVSSSSAVSSSTALSSSSFNPYTDLLIRFSDNSTSTGAANLKLYVVNKGNATANIGGYELRFYYNGNENLDASRLVFENYQNSSAVQSKVTEQCEENLFVYKVKFSDDAQIQPGASVPPGGMDLAVHLDTWQNYDWRGFASWVDASEPTDNPNMALFDANGNLVYGTEMWPCNGYTKKSLKLTVNETVHAEGMGIPNGYVNDAVGNVSLEVRNDGDSSLVGPVYVDFYVTHPASHVPMLVIGTDTLSVAGALMSLGDGIAVSRTSSGNRHTFRFVLANGLPAAAVRNISFVLLDQCLTDCPSGSESVYTWSLADDWSAMDGIANPWNSVKTEKVAVYSSTGELVYGTPDPSSPTPPMQEIAVGDTVFSLTHSRTSLASQVANRTDAVQYSAGQLLSGGDFESDWLHGWKVSGSAYSIRGNSPQGSRHLELASGARITQELPLQAGKMLADSGAVLVLWHTGTLTVEISKNEAPVNTNAVSGGGAWKRDTVFFAKSLFNGSSVYALSITANGALSVDDAILTAVTAAKPTTYAVRFTNTAGEELESRAYDGAEELLVTDSEHDGMGRTWKKYLPFALPCKGAADCNSERKTAHNSGMAKSYYTASNPDYPDAGGVPYVETKWKPDPMATKDVEGAPGSAFGVTGVDGRTHLVRSYSSGVNLSGVNLLDSASLNSAVAAVRHGRAYDGDTNYRAARDATPTHLWELNTDQDGRRAFTVKDGEDHVIVSGSLDSTGKLLTRSVNELDARGNVVKSHPPVSCGYTPRPANCVIPNEYGYDAQSRVVRSVEPDAGETRTFYDLMGRVRATQTQRQIDSGAYSVTVYDKLDRAIYTGEWKSSLDSGAARAYFGNVQNRNSPTIAELTPGSVTRTFYDCMPARDTLGVSLYPVTVPADAFRYGRTRTVAVISDVSVDGSGNVTRVSTANTYDKYGRVEATYTYDPTMPADSLKMLAVETEYDLGGKVTRTTKYPYGVDGGGASRKIVERYTYDRLGRIDSLFSKNGGGDEVLLAHYSYYPTGSVKTVIMGNSIILTYTYHISGAVKSATYTASSDIIPASSPSVILSDSEESLYSETLYYEDCGNNACTPQYNGNISRMVHELAHGNADFSQYRDVAYAYDQLNRLTKADDAEQDYFDEAFGYDAQGRMIAQRRDTSVAKNAGGEYAYYANTNRLKSIDNGMGGTADGRNMSDTSNFVYDSEGNLIEDKSKKMKILYDWRGMPLTFTRETENGDSLKLEMLYDGSGKRISKALLRKLTGAAEWSVERTTHYTGIGTEIRINNSGNAAETKVVINMPQGLGRYAIEYADVNDSANAGFEWYLKNHLGSTMAVYRTTGTTAGPPMLQYAYDYRSYGEKINLTELTDKVTENFTGKELDDGTELGYWGARYLDLMPGLWISTDPKRQFNSPYLYAGNGVNPVNGVDGDGNKIVSTNSAYNQKIADAMNSIASDQVKFYFDENNELKYSFNSSPVGKGSLTYAKTLAILSRMENQTFNITIDPSDKDCFKHGHGKTDRNGSVTLDGADNVTMNKNGVPVYQSFAEILMHEIVSHVAPMFESLDITPHSTHAIDDDNLIREEVGLPLRQENNTGYHEE